MKTILTIRDYDFPIVLESNRKCTQFRVTYGQQVRGNLTYSQAAKELGECLMHAIACTGALDPA